MFDFLKLRSGVLLVMLFASVAQADRLAVGDLDNLRNAGGVLIDIRSPAEAEKTGIIPGSYALPFFDNQGYSDGASWLAMLKEKIGADQPVILVSQHGDHSMPLCNMLKNEESFTQVLFLDGGINAWQQAGNELQLMQDKQAIAEGKPENEAMSLETMSITEQVE